MIRQRLHIDRYYWNVTAYYAVTGYHFNEIVSNLKRIGCDGEYIKTACANLKANKLNSGLTYSNYGLRETVLVVALASSAKDFHRAIMHEVRHLQSHIATAYNIDEKSEEVCYLLDDIVGEIHSVVAPLICECCRIKEHKHHERE